MRDDIPALDVDAAVDFLRRHQPGGPWYVCTGNPDKAQGTKGAFRTYECSASAYLPDAGLSDLIEQQARIANLYYNANPWRPGLRKKGKKTDVVQAAFVHADLDPEGDETPADAKARYGAALDAFVAQYGLKPTDEVDSGNGLQLLWRLKTPVGPETFERIEAINRAVMGCLGAKDSSTYNI